MPSAFPPPLTARSALAREATPVPPLHHGAMRPTPPRPHLVVEVRPGEGGDDAEAFAAELVAVVCAHLRRTGNPYRLEGADRTTVIVVDRLDPQLVALAGTHRIQRIPRNDPRGRRHTSTATVAILDTPSPPAPVAQLPECEVVVEPFSGSGAGGQYRNRHALCVRARHVPTGITVVSTRHRSLEQNLQAAHAELARRVHERDLRAASTDRNERRRAQVTSERSAKHWTWNDQRGEVVDHSSGRSWPLRQMLRGKLPPADR